MLFKVILPFETLAANFAAESQFGTFVRPFVDHQVVGFVEAALAIFADKLALGPHFPTKLTPTNVVLNLHYRKHGAGFFINESAFI